MVAIMRNDDAEALLLDIRAGRRAACQRVEDQRGAFLVFPTSVVVAGPGNAQLVYPLTTSLEPGTVVTSNGVATVGAVVNGITVSGTFRWTLDATTPGTADYRFRKRGFEVPPPPWVSQLPPSQLLAAATSEALARRQARLRRQAREAERCLMSLTERYARQACRGPISRAVSYRPAVEVDDLVQRVLQTAARLLPLYTSKDRPPSSWLRMLRLDGRRDMHRELTRLDWMSADAAAAVALAQAGGVRRQADPGDTLADLQAAAVRLNRPLPRVGASSLDAALRASLAALPEGPEGEGLAGIAAGEPPAVGDPALVAAVARLVTDDPALVAQAAAGDPDAVSRVGRRVVRTLGGGADAGPATRNRCWDQFQRSGQLFAGAAGRTHFGDRANLDLLHALDECLRRAAGLSSRATEWPLVAAG